MELKQIKQKGFTMIELVIVIAVLGVLAAFALPRFADFSSQAKTSASASVAGSLNAALGIVKAKYIAQGSTGTSVDLNGQLIGVTSTGDIRLDSVGDCSIVATRLLSSINPARIATGYNSFNKECYIDSRDKDWSITLTSTKATS